MADPNPVQIGWFEPDQTESMVALLRELFTHYNEGEPVTEDQVREHLTKNLLAERSVSKLLVAANADRIVLGFADLTFVYSLVDPRAAHNRQCLLKELYVSKAHRGQKIGGLLMKETIRLALQEGCARINWNVKIHNDDGIRFYKRYGAVCVEDRASYRIRL
ncbi:MAG: GNAT family N-acetyltransferase [Pseudomonadota bacterium]